MNERHTTITTAELPEPASERLVADLREFFPDATGGAALQASQTPPAWVEIITNLASWATIFKVAAAAYVAELTKCLAHDHWENRHRYRKEVTAGLGSALDRLQQFVGCLAEAGRSIQRRLTVRLCIQEPGHELTRVSAALDSEEELLETTAFFVHYLPGIVKAVGTIHAKHGRPAGYGIKCCLLQGAFQLTWLDQDWRQWQQVFEADGSPRTAQSPPSIGKEG